MSSFRVYPYAMSRTVDLVYAAELRRAALLRKARGALGLTKRPRLLPYRGYGTHERARMTVRVLEHRDIKPPAERRNWLDSAYASYQRYATWEIPGQEVCIEWAGRRWTGVTNQEGFAEVELDPPDVPAGWHDVAVKLTNSADAAETGHVFLIDRSTEYGVISDVDDTVIATNVTHPLKRAQALFLSEARTRLPFDGVNAFYNALHEGVEPARSNPIFYVSSSPWNLYEHINEFLELHGIPYGPVLLRDWGMSPTGFAPNGKHDHKLEKIRDVLELTGKLKFILIGDSGQRDPELYAEVVESNPGRILSVYIRNASSRKARAGELERIGHKIRQFGSEFLAVNDTVAAARHAASRGYIRWHEVEAVRQERDLSDAAP